MNLGQRPILKPGGKNCLHVRYKQMPDNPDVSYNYQPLQKQMHNGRQLSLRFLFKLHSSLRINITFTQFLLSDRCLPWARHLFKEEGIPIIQGIHPKCATYEGTEYMTLNAFYLCYKRPQWSVFPSADEIHMTYFVCTACWQQLSSIVFQYQVIDEGLVVSNEDAFNLRLLGTKEERSFGKLPHNSFDAIGSMTVKRNACMLKFMLIACKYQEIKLQQIKNSSTLLYLLGYDNHDKILQNLSTTGHSFVYLKYHYCNVLLDFKQTKQREYCRLCRSSSRYTEIRPGWRRSGCDLYENKGYYLGLKDFHGLNYVYENSTFEFIRVSDKNTTDIVAQSVCTKAFGCHSVLHLSTPHSTYVQVKVNGFAFHGRKLFTCFYGGVSFYISHKTRRQGLTTQREILTICSTVAHKKLSSTYYQYTSNQNEFILVLYQEFGDYLGIALSLSESNCKGTFVDTCRVRIGLPELPLETLPEFQMDYTLSRYTDDSRRQILYYQVPFEDNGYHCTVFQIGMKYFLEASGDIRRSSHIQKYGCSTKFEMRNPDRYSKQRDKWCSVKVSYTMFFMETQSLGDVPESGKFVFLNSVLNATHNLSQSKEDACAEKFENISRFKFQSTSEWTKRALTFKISSADKDISNKMFSTTVKFEHKQITSRSFTARSISFSDTVLDFFFINVAPRSETFHTIVYKFQECMIPKANFPTGLLHLGTEKNSPICLRQPVKGILDNNVVLQLSLETHAQVFYDSLGTITADSNLCLSNDHLFSSLTLSDLQYFLSRNIFRMCTDNQRNDGDDKLIWNSILRSSHFSSKPMVYVRLPGKITDIKLHAKVNKGQTIVLRNTWKMIPEKYTKVYVHMGGNINYKRVFKCMAEMYFKAQFYSTYLDHRCRNKEPLGLRVCHKDHIFCLLSKESDVQGYTEPLNHTWIEAKEMCKGKGFHLPSIVAQADVNKLIHYINIASFTRLIISIFIGIHVQHVVGLLSLVALK